MAESRSSSKNIGGKKKASQTDTSTKKEQNAVSVKKSEVKIVYLDEWKNFTTHEKNLLTTGTAERLARELVAWARGDENALKVSQFLEMNGISRRTWNRWVQKYEVFSDAYDYALMCIGNRREVGVMTRKFDSQSTSFMMLHYDEDWREAMSMKAKLSSPEGLSTGQKFVVLEKYPDSPMVPTRRSESEDVVPERKVEE